MKSASAKRTSAVPPGFGGRLHVLLLSSVSLVAVLPLLLHGVSCGHDLNFHLLNWMETAWQWKHGTLRPFWCFHGAWGAGEPRFVFYPPLSWMLGALLGTLLPWKFTPVAYTFVALLLGGLSMHRLLSHFVSGGAALLGAAMYLSNPYMLFVAYERTAYAELLAAAWMPLLLLAFFQPRMDAIRIAAVVALLWLTNAPAAILGSYTLLFLATLRIIATWRKDGAQSAASVASKTSLGYVLGLALAGFYLVPAIVQHRYVQFGMATLPGMRPVDNFLFAHTGDAGHDGVLRQASWIAVALLLVATLCALALLWRNSRHREYASMREWKTVSGTRALPRSGFGLQQGFAIRTLAVLTLLILFLLTPWSGGVWRHLPELTLLQFPWRFLSVLGAAAAMGCALLLPAVFRLRVAVPAALLIACSLVATGFRHYKQFCDEEDRPSAQRQMFVDEGSWEPTDEYTPSNSDNDALRTSLPPYWLTENSDEAPWDQPTADIVTMGDGHPEHFRFRVLAHPEEEILVVRLRRFRGWQVSIDGKICGQKDLPERSDGLTAIRLPAGEAHEVTIKYTGSKDERAGVALSFLAATFTAGALFRRDMLRIRTA